GGSGCRRADPASGSRGGTGACMKTAPVEAGAPTPRAGGGPSVWRGVILAGLALFLLAVVRAITGVNDLTSSGTFSATLRVSIPILLAGLGGLYAERAGIINIGLEGMMIFGTWFGAKSPDFFGWLEKRHWFLVSDLGAFLRGLTGNVSWLTILAIVLVPLSFWILWRTSFGLRLRSVGEQPVAAESLGVPVYTMKYVAVIISGGLAGMGGAFLVLEEAGIYREGQTGGRGFIALAALIFGNWRPTGVAAGAGLFGYADALQLRSDKAIHALLLFVAIGLGIAAIRYLSQRRVTTAVGVA